VSSIKAKWSFQGNECCYDETITPISLSDLSREIMEYFFDIQIGEVVDMITHHIHRIEERGALPKVWQVPSLIPAFADSSHRIFS
jgi:hypothetical protein